MHRCRLLILAAVLPEARAIARAFRLPADFRGGWVHGPAAGRGGAELVVGLMGLRALRLPQIVAAILPENIVAAGLAGALDPRLNVGDVVIDARHLAPVPPATRCYAGRIVTSERLIATPAEKQALFQASGALAVDMEGDRVRAWASGCGLPVTSIRAISDAADESLDPTLLTLLDDAGNPRLGRVAGLLARHPKKLKELLRIKRASDLALGNLSAALSSIVASKWLYE